MEIHGESMEIDGNHDNPLKSIRNRWKSIEIHGNHWKSIEIYRKSMENNGNQWKSMEIMGFFLEINRNLSKSIRNPWKVVRTISSGEKSFNPFENS